MQPQTAPWTSGSWDGDAYSTTGKTLIDLSAVFGVPAGVKAVLVRYAIRDSNASNVDCNLILSPNATDSSGPAVDCNPWNDRWTRGTMIVPCDANGDIYYQINASGAGTFDASLQIWGIWI
jgi:hypothetical protein